MFESPSALEPCVDTLGGCADVTHQLSQILVNLGEASGGGTQNSSGESARINDALRRFQADVSTHVTNSSSGGSMPVDTPLSYSERQ